MKINKKGFTLIELLAVIVVLGIVMTIGVTTVLPYYEKAQKNAFVTELRSFVDVTTNAVSLSMIGEFTETNWTVLAGDNETKCLTVANMISTGLLKKSDAGGYSGYVCYEKVGNSYTYYLNVKNAANQYKGVSSSLSADTLTGAGEIAALNNTDTLVNLGLKNSN